MFPRISVWSDFGLDSDSLSIPLTSLRWCAKVLMMRMHRQRHEALFASSPGGERG